MIDMGNFTMDTIFNSTLLDSLRPLNVTQSHKSTLIMSLYWTIALIGIIGNFLVIYIVVHDRQLLRRPTNLFLLNLAVADLIIILLGVEEIMQFMLHRGWLLGQIGCKILRSLMTISCYSSVLTLTAVCVERYCATVRPLKRHLLCTRLRTKIAIAVIWVVAGIACIPTSVLLQLHPISSDKRVIRCMRVFGSSLEEYRYRWMIFQYCEVSIFYLLPLVTQVTLYSIIGRTLFFANQIVRRRVLSCGNSVLGSRSLYYDARVLKMRQKVVKMLIYCVLVYFVCYSPVLVPLVYYTLTKSVLQVGHAYQMVTMTMVYANSAANPVLYTVFSSRFRRNFIRAFCLCCSLLYVRPSRSTDGGRPFLGMNRLNTHRRMFNNVRAGRG